MKKLFIGISSFVILSLIICFTFYLFCEENKDANNEYTVKFEEVFSVAQSNEKSFIDVSVAIIDNVREKHTRDVSIEWNDYLSDSMDKEAFEDIFVKENFALSFSHGDSNIEALFYVYEYFSNGNIGVVYLDNISDINTNHYLIFLNQYGNTKKLNDRLYVYYYELPYV